MISTTIESDYSQRSCFSPGNRGKIQTKLPSWRKGIPNRQWKLLKYNWLSLKVYLGFHAYVGIQMTCQNDQTIRRFILFREEYILRFREGPSITILIVSGAFFLTGRDEWVQTLFTYASIMTKKYSPEEPCMHYNYDQ